MIEINTSFYVYILISQLDNSFYIGQTAHLEKRLTRHNAGLEKYTKKKIPWKILWHTQVDSRASAMKLERKIKNMKSRKRIIEYTSTIGVFNLDAFPGL